MVCKLFLCQPAEQKCANLRNRNAPTCGIEMRQLAEQKRYGWSVFAGADAVEGLFGYIEVGCKLSYGNGFQYVRMPLD